MMKLLSVDGLNVQHETISEAEMYEICQEVPSHGVKMFILTPVSQIYLKRESYSHKMD